jgi:hypothetical protein
MKTDDDIYFTKWLGLLKCDLVSGTTVGKCQVCMNGWMHCIRTHHWRCCNNTND